MLLLLSLDGFGLMEMNLDGDTLLVGRDSDIRGLFQDLVTTEIGPRGRIALTHKREQIIRNSRGRRGSLHKLLFDRLNIARGNVTEIQAIILGGRLTEMMDQSLADTFSVSVHFSDGEFSLRENHGVI